MRSSVPTIIANTSIVHSDRVISRDLCLSHGEVVQSAAGAFKLDLRDHLVFPGLINAHDHLHLNAIPPLEASGRFLNSYEWIDAMERHRERPHVAEAASISRSVRLWHGALKNLLAGVTTVAHHDSWYPELGDPWFPVMAPSDLGWSHSLGLSECVGGRSRKYGPAVGHSFNETPSDRPWVIHAGEGVDDVASSELARLEELGCVAANTVLVHGVAFSDADVRVIVDRGASLVWCPTSNLRMFGRTLDVRALTDARRVALGTDSRLTGSRDLLDEVRVAARQSSLAPNELLALVTERARDILRLSNVGDLECGTRADCVIVRESGNPYEALLQLSRADIRAVVRGGVPLVADPDFAEWFEHCGVSTVCARLDGKPKLLARHIARTEAIALEPGLELVEPA